MVYNQNASIQNEQFTVDVRAVKQSSLNGYKLVSFSGSEVSIELPKDFTIYFDQDCNGTLGLSFIYVKSEPSDFNSTHIFIYLILDF